MEKTFNLLKEEFISSSTKTKQYLDFHKTFKKEFTNFLKLNNCNNIQIASPNHFDISGFFTTENNNIFYFSVEDLRWKRNEILVRLTKSYKDYTGRHNNFFSLSDEGLLSLTNLFNNIDFKEINSYI